MRYYTTILFFSIATALQSQQVNSYIEKGNDIRAAAGFILNSLLMAKNNTRKVISHSLIIANSNTVDDFPDLLYIAL